MPHDEPEPDPGPLPREERRRRTEAHILEAARELFAENGFERTTIRAVAGRAGIDPALVMQYYGSKEGLFAAAARWSTERDEVLSAPRDEVARTAVQDLLGKFEVGEGGREAAVALLRNCLTHPEASRIMRDEVMCERAAGVARTIGGDDADLRAGLIGACLIGLGMARYLLEIPAVANASSEDVARLMEPVLQALVDPPG